MDPEITIRDTKIGPYDELPPELAAIVQGKQFWRRLKHSLLEVATPETNMPQWQRLRLSTPDDSDHWPAVIVVLEDDEQSSQAASADDAEWSNETEAPQSGELYLSVSIPATPEPDSDALTGPLSPISEAAKLLPLVQRTILGLFAASSSSRKPDEWIKVRVVGSHDRKTWELLKMEHGAE